MRLLYMHAPWQRMRDGVQVCPKCGSGIGDEEYCHTCGLHLSEETEIPTKRDWEAKAGQAAVERKTRPGSTKGPRRWSGAPFSVFGLSVVSALAGVVLAFALGLAIVMLTTSFSQRFVVFIVPAVVLGLLLVVLGVIVALRAGPNSKEGVRGSDRRPMARRDRGHLHGCVAGPAVDYRLCGSRITIDATPDVSGCDLAGQDLSGLNKPGANLARANLQDAKLTDANFTAANLTGANLTVRD